MSLEHSESQDDEDEKDYKIPQYFPLLPLHDSRFEQKLCRVYLDLSELLSPVNTDESLVSTQTEVEQLPGGEDGSLVASREEISDLILCGEEEDMTTSIPAD